MRRDYLREHKPKLWMVLMNSGKLADHLKDTQGCMYKRNRHLVDHSGICVCYLTKDSGGTAYTVRYARTHGLEIINLACR